MDLSLTPPAGKAGASTAFLVSLSAVVALGAVLSACGGAGKDDAAAYEVCLVSAKADKNVGKAVFADQKGSNIQGSTGDAGMRVNIPYELDGKKGLFQCIAEKQTDGKFKVTN